MTLYEHQQKIVADDRRRALIALGTGGGKTRVCLELAEGKTLVVCPKQQKLDRTWENNAAKFQMVVDLTVMSKEEFRRDAEKLGVFDTVIFDECHTILGVSPETRQRNRVPIPKTSQLFEAALSFIKRTNPTRLYLASATPVTKPMHLWALGTLFGKEWDFFKFRAKYYIRRMIGYREIWLPNNRNDLKERIASIAKSFGYTGQLSDWFDVPDQRHETIYVDLTEEQKEAIESVEIEEADALVARARKRVIENGIEYTFGTERISDKEEQIKKKTLYYASNKLLQILEISRQCPKCLIFAAYTGQVEAISSVIRKDDLQRNRSRKVFTLTGSTKDRQNVVKDAETAQEAIVIAQSSISAGYELPSFPCVIFASKSYRYVDYEQALGRVLRANAIKKNFYYHLVVRGGVDEDCHKAIMSGQDFQEKLMQNI